MKRSSSPHPVDAYVGQRIRARRILAGITQTQLAISLGISFQQIQKYEKGTNRIGASRLDQISARLGVPVDYFFEGRSEGDPASTSTIGTQPLQNVHSIKILLNSSEGIALARAFSKISDPQSRRILLTMATTLAAQTAKRIRRSPSSTPANHC